MALYGIQASPAQWQTLYSRREPILGSHFETTACRTAAYLQDAQERGRHHVEQNQHLGSPARCPMCGSMSFCPALEPLDVLDHCAWHATVLDGDTIASQPASLLAVMSGSFRENDFSAGTEHPMPGQMHPFGHVPQSVCGEPSAAREASHECNVPVR